MPRPHSSTPTRLSAADRQHRLSGLHRAEAVVGEEQRAGDFRAGAQGAAAEGLSPALADRRIHFGDVGFGRHRLARRGAARLVARTARRDFARRAADAVAGRRHRSRAARCAPKLAGEWGMGDGVVDRRRRRRQRGLGLRHGHGRSRAPPSCRSARPACCLRPTLPICPIPKAPCTPSAMRCPTPGTRWASSCRRRIR